MAVLIPYRNHFRKLSPALLFRTIFAGMPYASTFAGREDVTNDPDSTTVFSPMLTLSTTVAPRQTAAYFFRPPHSGGLIVIRSFAII